MSKRSKKSTKRQAPTMQDGRRLVVVGVRRKEPDWDGYVAALLSFALRQVEAENESAKNGNGR
jgi:hypothetical protein